MKITAQRARPFKIVGKTIVAQESELDLFRTCYTCICMHVACTACVLDYVRTAMHTVQCSTEMHIVHMQLLVEGSMTSNRTHN